MGKQMARLIVNDTKMDVGAVAASRQVQYGASVFGERLFTLGVVGGNGSIEVLYAWKIERVPIKSTA
jgi:hypothetical protein